MKISVIISTVLIAQVSASFFDVFQGAVLSVQNSFGKLLSDIVTDVRDTVDCTILAVEQVISWSDEATLRYYDKCGSGVNKTALGNNSQQDVSFSRVKVSLQFANNEDCLEKQMRQKGIDTGANETLSKFVGSYDDHVKLISVENALPKESEQLADVGDKIIAKHPDYIYYSKTDNAQPVQTDDLQKNILPNNILYTTPISPISSSANEDNVRESEFILETPEIFGEKSSSRLKEVSDNTESSIKADRNEESFSLTINESPSTLKTLNYNVLNNIVMKSTLFPITKSTFVSKIIHPSESVMYGTKSLSTSPSVTGSDLNETVENEAQLSLTILPPLTEDVSNIATVTRLVMTETGTESSELTLTTRNTNTRDGNEAQLALTSLQLLNEDASNDALLTSTAFVKTECTPAFETIQLNDISTTSGIHTYLTFGLNQHAITPNKANGDKSNGITKAGSLDSVTESIHFIESIHSLESTTGSGNEASALTKTTSNIVNDSILADTIVTNTVDGNGAEFTLTIPNSLNDEISDDDVSIITVSLTTECGDTIQSVETSTVSHNEEYLNFISNAEKLNKTALASSSITITENTDLNESIHLFESVTDSKIDELSVNVFTTTLATLNESDFNDINTLSPTVESTAISDIIRPVGKAVDSRNEVLSTVTIKFLMTDQETRAVSLKFNKIEANDIVITSTLPTSENTIVTEITQPVENSVTGNDEPSVLTIKSDVTAVNKVNNNYSNEIEAATSLPVLPGASTKLNEIVQPDETTTVIANKKMNLISNVASTTVTTVKNVSVNETSLPKENTIISRNEESSSVSSHQLILNTRQVPFIEPENTTDLVVISTPVKGEALRLRTDPPDENILKNTITMSTLREIKEISYNELSTSAEKQLSPAPKILPINHDLNQFMREPPFYRSLLLNKNIPRLPASSEWPAPNNQEMFRNEFKQQNYNTNGENRNYYNPERQRDDSYLGSVTTSIYIKSGISPKLFSQITEHPKLTNFDENAMRTVDSISKNVLETGIPFNIPVISDHTTLTPNKLIPNIYNHQTNADRIADKIPDTPITAVNTYASGRPINPQRMYYVNPPYMHTPNNLIRPPYFLERSSANTEIPRVVLTTYRPRPIVLPRVNTHNDASLDFGSFSLPQKDTETHQLAIREARQLIENSKRSDQIIDSILKNSYGVRNMFQ